MGYTSTAVKAKYNKKTYKDWKAAIRNADFDKIEEKRAETGLSRSAFIKMLVCKEYGISFEEE